jgi:hypothetical protein
VKENMSNIDELEDYEVGYGKPPKSGQFKKGISGNPSGRPKKPSDFLSVLMKELESKVTIHESGKAKSYHEGGGTYETGGEQGPLGESFGSTYGGRLDSARDGGGAAAKFSEQARQETSGYERRGAPNGHSRNPPQILQTTKCPQINRTSQIG